MELVLPLTHGELRGIDEVAHSRRVIVCVWIAGVEGHEWAMARGGVDGARRSAVAHHEPIDIARVVSTTAATAVCCARSVTTETAVPTIDRATASGALPAESTSSDLLGRADGCEPIFRPTKDRSNGADRSSWMLRSIQAVLWGVVVHLPHDRGGGGRWDALDDAPPSSVPADEEGEEGGDFTLRRGHDRRSWRGGVVVPVALPARGEERPWGWTEIGGTLGRLVAH